MKPRIFISYRRDDAAGYAGRLADHLEARFGDANVFRDIEDLEGGVDFESAIVDAVSNCGALVVVIGPDWLGAVDSKTGGRRLDQPKDYVRLEIEAALERNVLTLPVLVGETPMPAAEALPDSLAPLARRQALPLSDDRWSFDVERVIRVLEPVVRAPAKTGRWRTIAGLAAAVALISVLGITAWSAWNGRRGPADGSVRPEVGNDPGPADGGGPPRVPQLTGLRLDDALERLRSAGIQAGVITKTTTGSASPDEVRAQRPEAGTELRESEPVSLMVEFPVPAGAIAGGQRIPLDPGGTLNLDGPGDADRRGLDISLRGSGADVVVSPLNGATLAAAPLGVSSDDCNRLVRRFRTDPVGVRDAMNAKGICVRTSAGNLAGVVIAALDQGSGEVAVGFITWSGRQDDD